jgi:UDP-N-acetylmuramate dehydrogenase
MTGYTSLRVGGAADVLAKPRDRDELRRLLAICCEHTLLTTLIGAGFNTLVSDAGIEGVVICLKKFRSIRIEDTAHGGKAIRAESGVSHSQVTNFCIQNGLGGLEFGAGIPGTVGGWVAMNAGIGSRELVDVVLNLEVIRPDGSPPQAWKRDDLDFAYRSLRGLPVGSVIVSAVLAASPTDPAEVKAEVDRLLSARAESQPLDVPSCGSVFKNPEGDFAGRLIDAAGLKGERIGGAQISPVHANFIANIGGATAADVQALIAHAQEEVFRTSGIQLAPEVRIVGRTT